MTYFIIIRGPLGIGKSTIAKRLSKILNAKYIDIDTILKKSGLDKINPKEKCIPSKNFIKAQNIIIPKVKEKLDNNKIVIFDACFYHKEAIEHLTKNLSYDHYIFTLKAPLELCIKRDSKRKKTHGKDSARAVHKLVSRFDFGIIIDTKDKTVNRVIREILSHLPKS